MTNKINKKTLQIKVMGRVQKVGFRNFIFDKALELSIKGSVENQKDGSVYIEAQASDLQLDEFLEWCYKGSPLSRVDKIDVKPIENKEFTDFRINRN